MKEEKKERNEKTNHKKKKEKTKDKKKKRRTRKRRLAKERYLERMEVRQESGGWNRKRASKVWKKRERER